VEFIRQKNTFYIFSEVRIQKETEKQNLEKIQDPNNFFCYEEIGESTYQIFLLPVSIIEKINHQVEPGKAIIIPYQVAIRHLIGTSQPILFLHVIDSTLLITGIGIHGNQVSLTTQIDLSQPNLSNLKDIVNITITDLKTIFRVDNFVVAINSPDIAEQLKDIEVQVIRCPHNLPTGNLPRFILPQHIEFQKAQEEKKQIKIAGGAVVILMLLAGAYFYQTRQQVNQLYQQRNLLQKQVQIEQIAFMNAQQQDIAKYFTSTEKNKVISIISRLSLLPAGYTFKNLVIKQIPNGNYQADIFISVIAPGMSARPLKSVFPDGVITPLFKSNGQEYRIHYSL
jgi:hypothetical protein